MNSYLFLDFDGVCNSHEYFFGSGKHRRYAATLGEGAIPSREQRLIDAFDPEALKHLNRIASESGCFVVISSSWRIQNSVGAMRRAMHQRGFEHANRIISKTGYRHDGDSTNRRGLEIQDWLNQNSVGAVRLAILDDDRDMGHLMPYLVKTSWETGLLEEHVAPTLKLLGDP